MKKSILLFFIFCLPMLATAQFWEHHWTDQNYIFTGSGGDVLSVTPTACEEGLVQVTDPLNVPLAAYSPIIVNPKNSGGEEITDISAFPLSFSMRARSAEQIIVGVLFRSDDGSAGFRTSILYDTIPAGLEAWTEISITFSGEDISGFNAGNLRDCWFFLDRGSDNFAGNELYIDYITLGGGPSPGMESPCEAGIEPDGVIFAEYFSGQEVRNINTGSSAGQVTTFTLDTICETLQLRITDPENAPLTAYNAYQVNPFSENGEEITDISDKVQFTMRVRSAEALDVDVLFRSGEGTNDERSDRKTVSIPGGLENWTSFTIALDSSDYAGFDPSDLRDIWFYLDRGSDNFAGNEFYIDHIVIGGQADTTRNSPCDQPAESGEVVFADYFQADSLRSINTGSTAGVVTTFTLDMECETLQLSIPDPNNNPLPPYNAYLVNPIDENGEDITDLSGRVNVSMRVRSAGTINMDILFRSGEGTQEERSARKAVTILGGLENWTSFTLEFSESELEGFKPDDLRDMWFYLDRGTPNFAGNELYIDHIIIGGQADSSRYSPCTTEVLAQSWLENWDTDTPSLLGGSETSKLTLTQTACEEIKIEVTDSLNEPYLAFRPIVINPVNERGSAITNISEQVQVVIRARSAAEVPIGVLFRSGDGSADFRTATLTQKVSGTLDAWTTLTYTFTEEGLGGFDPENLRDLWIFLDRENNNFPGNELYLDYIAIGAPADSTVHSPCGLPDVIVSTDEVIQTSFFDVYPNPVKDQLQIEFQDGFYLENDHKLLLFDASGRLVRTQSIPEAQKQFSLDVSNLPKGLWYLQIRNRQYYFTKQILKH